MDSKTLEMIVALAEERSVVSAAERLNIDENEVYSFCIKFKQMTQTNFLDQAFLNNFLSGQGMEVYEKAKKILDELDGFNKWMYDLRPEPAGDITIVTTPFIGIKWFMPKLRLFLDKNPRVCARFILKNPPIQPGEGDVVITTSAIIKPKGFSTREVLCADYGLYASPEYLEKRGAPKKAADLDHHHLISFRSGYAPSQGYYDWSLTSGLALRKSPRKPYFEVDSTMGILDAALLGMGIAELPNVDFIIQCPDLVRVIPSLKSNKTTLHYICERGREDTPLIGELFNHFRAYSLKKQ